MLTIETLLVRDIIHQENSHGASVVCGCNGAETLLACRVPYLQFHPLSIQINRPDLEIDAYRSDERGCETVFGEAKEAARLSYARIADEQQFDLGHAVSGQGLGWEDLVKHTKKS